jgi:hypothetical protein
MHDEGHVRVGDDSRIELTGGGGALHDDGCAVLCSTAAVWQRRNSPWLGAIVPASASTSG